MSCVHIITRKHIGIVYYLLKKEIAKFDAILTMNSEVRVFVMGLKKKLSFFKKGFLGWIYIG